MEGMVGIDRPGGIKFFKNKFRQVDGKSFGRNGPNEWAIPIRIGGWRWLDNWVRS